MSVLGEVSPATFLAEYWQQKPLLIRRGIDLTDSVLSPEELAGLACEQVIESRLIIGADRYEDWQLREGPFDASIFSELGLENWTLLVQDVDKFIPRVHDLLQLFWFLPRWLIDDIMVSHAAKQGSVGAHVDNYDVFLIQAAGRRRWQIASHPTQAEELVEGCPLRVLQEFSPDQTWDLEAGDVLYLPPRLAHHGVALDSRCMTYSVGLRAPRYAELRQSFSLEPQVDDDTFLTSRDLVLRQDPGQIGAEAIKSIAKIVAQNADDEAFLKWLGSQLTEPKFRLAGDPVEITDRDHFHRVLKEHGFIRRDENSRFAYVGERAEGMLFVDGRYVGLYPPALLRSITNGHDLPSEVADGDPVAQELLWQLYQSGSLYFPG